MQVIMKLHEDRKTSCNVLRSLVKKSTNLRKKKISLSTTAIRTSINKIKETLKNFYPANKAAMKSLCLKNFNTEILTLLSY